MLDSYPTILTILTKLLYMRVRRVLPLLTLALALFVFHTVSGSESVLIPNTSIEAGSSSLFNLSINNTNSTTNITSVNLTLPQGFMFYEDSNSTSSLANFTNTTGLFWGNISLTGIIENLTTEWFAFNSSVNFTPGDYNLTLIINYTDASTNITTIGITVNDTTAPFGLAPVSPTPANNSWINSSWFLVNITFTELNPDTCLLDLGNGSSQNWTMSRTGSTCTFNASNQSQGTINWSVWINDTSGNLGAAGVWFLNIGAIPHDLALGSQNPSNGSVTTNDWAFFNLSFTEQNPDTCILNYSNGTSYDLNMTVNDSQGFCYLNLSMPSEGHFNYSFWMNNTQGASNSTGTFFITVDLTPTSITNISENIGFTTANISWETTHPVDSRIYYGSGLVTNLTLNQTNTTNSSFHYFLLDNLTTNTKYFYNISSCDNLSICNTSGTWNFTTLCIEAWSYGSWGSCSGGIQYRSASDQNSCGTTDNRSATSQACDEGGGGGGGGGGDSAPVVTKVWRNIFPASPALVSIGIAGIAARTVILEVSETVGTSNCVVKGFSSKPFSIDPPPRTVQSYMNITSTVNASRLSRVIIEFEVQNSWLERNDVPPEGVSLMRLNQVWEDLPTILLQAGNETALYKSESPGLSWFAVTGTTGANPVQNDTGPTGSQEPGTETGETGTQEPEGPVVPDEVYDLCVPGEKECLAGWVIQTCNAFGTGWVNQQRCLYGCFGGECSETLVIEIDYNSLWIAVIAVLIIVILTLVYTKRRAIDDFIFWRLR